MSVEVHCDKLASLLRLSNVLDDGLWACDDTDTDSTPWEVAPNVGLAEWIREWTPTLGVLGAGAWIFFNWLRDERHRQKTEMPAMDGTLSVTSTSLSADKSILAVTAVWRNRGALPIRMLTQKTRIEVFCVTPDVPCGAIEVHSNLGSPVATHHPYADQSAFVFEPATESELQSHLIVLKGSVYLVRWWLELDTGHPELRECHNTREVVCDLRHGPIDQ